MMEKTLISEDGSTLNDLKKGNFLLWVSLIVLSLLFLPLILMFLYFAIFGFLPNMDMPEVTRILFGFGAIFILNIFLTSGCHKPIKIYKEGIDLGTHGSLGWISFIFGFIFYFKKTIIIEWKNIEGVTFSFNKWNKEIIKVIDSNQRTFYCTLYDGEKSYNDILNAIKSIHQEDKIIYETKS